MKVKLKNKNCKLPNCWKQCGVSKEDWDNLASGQVIEVKAIPNLIVNLVDAVNSTTSKNKGGK